MSSVFVELGLLVLAAFALGLLVGWLAWASGSRRDGERRPATVGGADPTGDESLPRWQGRAAPAERPRRDPGSHRQRLADPDPDPTVVAGPRGWVAVGSNGSADLGGEGSL